jgi:tetratricopeptide (TPR) repeat protein
LENLLRAIALHEKARAYFNLALTLLEIGRSADLDRAADVLEKSLRLRPREVVPLAWAESARHLAAVYRRRAAMGGPTTSLCDAADLLAQIVDGINLKNFPDQAEKTFRELGHVQADLGDWSAAAQSWLQAIGAGDRLYRASLLRQTQESALSRTSGLPRLAAYAFARSGDPQAAVTVLERGRSRLLGERLSRDRSDLTALAAADRTLFTAYEDAANRIRALESRAVEMPASPTGSSPFSGADIQGAMADARAQLDAVVAAIRRLPEYESFLVESDLGVIAEAVTTDLPVAYLTVTEHGSIVLLVHVEASTGDVAVEALLGELREGDLLAAVASYPDTGSMDDLDRRLWELLPLVGERLLAPVAARLNELGAKAIAFVATGILCELPLQAAYYERAGRVIHLLDEFDVYYAPSARVLAAARAAAGRATGQPLLVGVGNPQPTHALPGSALRKMRRENSNSRFGSTAVALRSPTQAWEGKSGWLWIRIFCRRV